MVYKKIRQGLVVTIKQLRDLADEFEKEQQDLNKELGIDKSEEEYEFSLKQDVQLGIINKTGASDGWIIE
jgi:hypothetical protein